MIITDVKIEGVRKKHFLKFYDGQCPRIGETIELGTRRYRVVDVKHRFDRLDIVGAFHNEKYFTGIPPIQITLRKLNET